MQYLYSFSIKCLIINLFIYLSFLFCMNPLNLAPSTQSQNAQQYLTATQIVIPIKKQTLIKPKNHNLFNNPEYFRSIRGTSPHGQNTGTNAMKNAIQDQDIKDDQSQKARKYNLSSSDKKFFFPENQRQNKIQFLGANQPISPSFDAIVDEGLGSGPISIPESQNSSVRNIARININNNNNFFNAVSPRENAYASPQLNSNAVKTPKDNAGGGIGIIEDFNYRSKNRNRPQIFQNSKNILQSRVPSIKPNGNEYDFGSQTKLPFFTNNEQDKGAELNYDFSHIKELNQDNFLKYIHPKQRETIYLLFGEKRDHWQQSWQNQKPNEKDLFVSDNNSQKTITYYEKLDRRAEKLKDRLRDTSKIVSHMMERRKKFLLEHEELIKSIERYKDSLEIIQKTSKKKVFERDIQLLVEQIKLKIEDLKDKYREANDLIVIFSIASNQYLNSNQNWQSSNSSMMDLNKMQNQQIHSQNISKVESHYKQIQSTYNYQSVFHQSSNMLDFDSRALQIYQEFQQQIRNLDAGLNEYKKYLKLDIEGEEFNIRTQELLQILKQCTTFTADAEKEIILLNQELGNNLKEITISLKQNVEFYTRVYQAIEESFDLVCKLIYLSQSKFKEMNEQISETTKDIELFVSKFLRRKQTQQKSISISQQQSQSLMAQLSSTKNSNQLVYNEEEIKKGIIQIQQRIQDILQNTSSLKKQVKQLATDPRCQYFIQLRFKQSNKIIYKLELMNSQVDCLQRFIQLVCTRLDEDLNEIIQFQEQMKKITNEFGAITQIKEHKRVTEMLKQLYQGCNLLISNMGSSLNRLNCYIEFNQIGSAQKNFFTIQAQLQSGIQEITKLQEKILIETKKKGKSEQFELNMKKLDEFSDLCQKEIENFKRQKDYIFFNFQDSEKFHMPAMIALGNARQAYNIMNNNMKEDPALQQFEKQIVQQKNTLELCNTIFENISYLQLQNFQYLSFNFNIKDNKLDYETNLDELLQGVDESLKNITQCWETVQNQAYEKFLNDITQKLIEMIKQLYDFISFWMKGVKLIVKKIKESVDSKHFVKKEFQQKIIDESIEPFLNFLNNRISSDFSSYFKGIINVLAKKVNECCANLIVFVYEGTQKEVTYENIEAVTSQLEEKLNQRSSIPKLPVLYDLYKCVNFLDVEKSYENEEIRSRIKLLRSRVTELLVSQIDNFINQKDQKVLLMLSFYKDVVLNESILHYKDQIDSLIDFCLHLNSRFILIQQILDESKQKWKQQIYVQIDQNETSFFSYLLKYYDLVNKGSVFDQTLNSLIATSQQELRNKLQQQKEKSNKIFYESLGIQENGSLHSELVQDLYQLLNYFQSLSIYKQMLLNSEFYFLSYLKTDFKQFATSIQAIHDALLTLKEATIVYTFKNKYLPNPSLDKQQIFQVPFGVFLGINGFNRIVELKNSQILDSWIKIFNKIQQQISETNNKMNNIKSIKTVDIFQNISVYELNENQINFINKFKNINYSR
ncbi:transmembrane protein, putative (macronuclear) [Tetrahymena thermophila SB210]|uniref:Transmembrane protein, putative n=1 Tax=Tetrahymena thermophila (strain SB210) TaxID=312017 RepID=Q22UR3_TETTS|nr:transmembrane protein, putative [Tetrahymena thermophila SB210]EAR89063.2 transmembrane protein, putative [Tetrahymena thermophila SB210]|eukprot:XP_001009308.2 transmembrane protein, putative [Tetrahymena thermophila SB210]